jgi:hypothetical protein
VDVGAVLAQAAHRCGGRVARWKTLYIALSVVQLFWPSRRPEIGEVRCIDLAGAILNEVAAVTRRLIEGLLGASDNCPKQIRVIQRQGLEQTRGALRTGNNVHRTLGVDVIRAYLGQGKPERSHRSERQIREAIS